MSAEPDGSREPDDAARRLFERAIELEGAQRDAWIDRACRGDAPLAAEVASLLDAHRRAGGFLETPVLLARPSGWSAPAADGDAPRGAPLELAGYRILERIGEGSMGSVYSAEQLHPLRRSVAIKLLKHSRAAPDTRARFEREARTLASMQHPCVATVFDHGHTADGEPFLVMEHVPGRPITAWCDAERLDVEQRVRLFALVCEGIQHAHQKGIVHRDLKPSNVLVSAAGERPVPKLIDFGLAKALDAPLPRRAGLTLYGEVLGTPEYMSPEQFGFESGEVDTRADIYSAGVVLYELLTGRLPHDLSDLREASIARMRERIASCEPRLPSACWREARAKADDAGADRAHARGATRKALARRLRGDLDWIAMKCLEKDRERRYASASDLAADLRRHLAHEPVAAGPPSAIYRLRKLARRKRVAFAAGGAFLLALQVGLALTAWQAVRAGRAERTATTRLVALDRANRRAERRLEEALAAKRDAELASESFAMVNELLNELLAAPNPTGAGEWPVGARDVRVLDVLEAAVAAIDERFGARPEVLALAQLTIAETLAPYGEYERAEALFRSAHALFSGELGPHHERSQRALLGLGRVLTRRNACDEAERVLLHALRTTWNSAARSQHEELVLELLCALCEAELERGHPETALRLGVVALARCERALGAGHALALRTRHELGLAYYGLRRYEEAEAQLQRALAGWKELRSESHPEAVAELAALANLYTTFGRWDEAIETNERVVELQARTYGAEHLVVQNARRNLAVAFGKSGRIQDCKDLLAAVLESADGSGTQCEALARYQLGALLAHSAAPEQGRGLLELALAQARACFPADHPVHAQIHLALGRYGLAVGDGELAEHELRQCLERSSETTRPNDATFAQALQDLGRARMLLGRPDEGERLLLEAIAAREPMTDLLRVFDLQKMHRDLGLLYASLHRHAEAVERFALALDVPGEGQRIGQGATLEILFAQGACSAALARWPDVLASTDRALALIGEGEPSEAHARALLQRGLAHAALRDVGEAEEALLRARDEFVAVRGTGDERGADALRALVELYTAVGRLDDAAAWREELGGS